jgi:hypothetical protein
MSGPVGSSESWRKPWTANSFRPSGPGRVACPRAEFLSMNPDASDHEHPPNTLKNRQDLATPPAAGVVGVGDVRRAAGPPGSSINLFRIETIMVAFPVSACSGAEGAGPSPGLAENRESRRGSAQRQEPGEDLA